MPFLAPQALATLDLLAATAKKSSGGSSFFLIFIVIIAGVYLLFIAPQRRKQRAQMAQQRTFEVGDEIVTSGGIYGRVASSEGDRVALDIADGLLIEVARTAIARRVEQSATGGQADMPPADAPAGAGGEETGAAEHDWNPPEPGETTGSNGNGPTGSGDWADPWSTPPVDGEQGAAPSEGSA